MVVNLSKTSEADSSAGAPRLCGNCGQEVPELFCTRCGQNTKEIRVSFRSLLRDFAGEFFNYDSKFIRTVIPLFVRPGFLTNAFLDGKRVRYVAPLRLYVLSSVFFFLILAIVSKGSSSNGSAEVRRGAVFSVSGNKTEAFQQPENRNGELGARNSSDPSSNRRGARFTDARFDNGSWFGRYINERLDAQDRKIQEIGYDAFMRELVGEFMSSLPMALFFLMPFFALLLKLFYWRSAPLYIDHLIFAFHYHAFVYVLTSIFLIVGSRADVLLAFSIAFGFFSYPVYLLLAMKRVYKQKWLWTVLKFSIVSLIYFTTLAMFLPFFFILSAFFLV